MATPATGPAPAPGSQSSRGKDQLPWSADTWQRLDEAVSSQMAASRQCSVFLPQNYRQKHESVVNSDIVIVPPAPSTALLAAGLPYDASLSVDETQYTRIHEYQTTLRLTMAQVAAEEQLQAQASAQAAAAPAQTTSNGQAATTQATTPPAATPPRAARLGGTAASLVMRTAIPLAQAEDAIILTGQLALACSPLFLNQLVQSVDPNLQANLDLGLLNIQQLAPGAQGNPSTVSPSNVIMLPPTQVVVVPPSVDSTGFPPQYREQTLGGIASGVSKLQAYGHYGHYAFASHTQIHADLHSALPTTLVEPAEPISHLVDAIVGTGAMPPFIPITSGGQPATTGLPTLIQTSGSGSPLTTTALAGGLIPADANVLYTAVLVSLEGNTMDLVRCKLDDSLDVNVNFLQKNQLQQTYLRVFHRFCLRLMDVSAVVLMIFTDKSV
jgi:hypothetical protein